MGPDIVVPVSIFGAIVLIVWLTQMYTARKRSEAFATLRAAIEKGQEVTPEAMEAMSRAGHPLADLRRGILLLALAFGFVGLAAIVGTEEEEAIRPLLGIGVFPLALGLAYIGLHVFTNGKSGR